METLTVKTSVATSIFESTGFSYDLTEIENNDGTSTITFDSKADYEKFQKLAGK